MKTKGKAARRHTPAENGRPRSQVIAFPPYDVGPDKDGKLPDREAGQSPALMWGEVTVMQIGPQFVIFRTVDEEGTIEHIMSGVPFIVSTVVDDGRAH